jgi:hypothetical protein
MERTGLGIQGIYNQLRVRVAKSSTSGSGRNENLKKVLEEMAELEGVLHLETKIYNRV